MLKGRCSFYVQPFYLGALLCRVFYVQVFYVQSSTFSLSTKSRSTFCRIITQTRQVMYLLSLGYYAAILSIIWATPRSYFHRSDPISRVLKLSPAFSASYETTFSGFLLSPSSQKLSCTFADATLLIFLIFAFSLIFLLFIFTLFDSRMTQSFIDDGRNSCHILVCEDEVDEISVGCLSIKKSFLRTNELRVVKLMCIWTVVGSILVTPIFALMGHDYLILGQKST